MSIISMLSSRIYLCSNTCMVLVVITLCISWCDMDSAFLDTRVVFVIFRPLYALFVLIRVSVVCLLHIHHFVTNLVLNCSIYFVVLAFSYHSTSRPRWTDSSHSVSCFPSLHSCIADWSINWNSESPVNSSDCRHALGRLCIPGTGKLTRRLSKPSHRARILNGGKFCPVKLQHVGGNRFWWEIQKCQKLHWTEDVTVW